MIRVLTALVLLPSAAVAQIPLATPTPSVVESSLRFPPFSDPVYQSPPPTSAAKTIAIHTAVGTGVGLLTGALLSSASVSNDRTAVILTWTALGAAAGLVSGVVTWLVQR